MFFMLKYTDRYQLPADRFFRPAERYILKEGHCMAEFTQSVRVDRAEDLIILYGSFDENIRLIEQQLHVSVASTESELRVSGDIENVLKAVKVLDGMISLIIKGENIDKQRVSYLIMIAQDGREIKISEISSDVICINSKGYPVKGKTAGQKKYIDAIRHNTVTLSVGPAGTGKTYLAVAMAVSAFRDKQISRIILTRPAVEAGEKLGFLPGDIQSKVDPYLRPLYDALFDMLGTEAYLKYLERGNIEVAPLAFMRGRTLDDSFIILDEAQNTTGEQMKMFLTRLGFNSKIVVNGDVTQIDLPDGKKSGLKEAAKLLRGIDDISIVELTDRDIVRHELVGKIIRAYESRGGKQL